MDSTESMQGRCASRPCASVTVGAGMETLAETGSDSNTELPWCPGYRHCFQFQPRKVACGTEPCNPFEVWRLSSIDNARCVAFSAGITAPGMQSPVCLQHCLGVAVAQDREACRGPPIL